MLLTQQMLHPYGSASTNRLAPYAMYPASTAHFSRLMSTNHVTSVQFTFVPLDCRHRKPWRREAAMTRHLGPGFGSCTTIGSPAPELKADSTTI
jgi:hypothetical protein